MIKCLTYLVAALLPFAVLSDTFSVDSSGNLLRNGSPTVVHGFALTCMEYLLQGIGTVCTPAYNFNDPSNIITAVNTQQMEAIYAILLPVPAGVTPAIRLSLNAGYYLDVPTPNWAANRATYPNLAQQYRTLVANVVASNTAKGVVTILDLHWNDDVLQQQAMALKGTSISGDSLAFWQSVSTTFASNPLAWYELYNEPHAPSLQVYMSGNTQFEGMQEMYDLVLSNKVTGMILVGGAFDFSYDADSLVSFAEAQTVTNQLAFVFHPYMGPDQSSDTAKNAPNFEILATQVLTTTKQPIIATELGQFCCVAEGSCFLYDGTFNGVSMGYARAILTIMQSNNIGWTVFGFRPGTGGECTQPDANDGTGLYNSANHNGEGANMISLFPTFYPANSATTTTTTTSAPVTAATNKPTTAPPTNAPVQPTNKPTTASQPTNKPTQPPTKAPGDASTPTNKPTTPPPTKAPTNKPTTKTTQKPTKSPTRNPNTSIFSTEPPSLTSNFTEPPGFGDSANNVSGAGVGIGVTAGFTGLAVGAFLYRRQRKQRLSASLTATGGTAAAGVIGFGAMGGELAATPCVLCTAISNYNATGEGEISFRAGETIQLIQRSSGGWWEGMKFPNGETGLFPGECVRLNSMKWGASQQYYA